MVEPIASVSLVGAALLAADGTTVGTTTALDPDQFGALVLGLCLIVLLLGVMAVALWRRS